MRTNKLLLVLFFFWGIMPQLIGQIDSNGNVDREKPSITTESQLHSASKQTNRKESLYNDIIRFCNLEVSFDKDQHFHVVDSVYGFYSPTALVKDFKGFQILRTFAEDSDSSYIIGIMPFPVSPLSGTYPLKETLTNEARILMNGNDRFYESKSCKYLNIAQLKKINASRHFGIIYNMTISKPFKGKYSKCKVIAAEDKKAHYFTLYYFYKGATDKKITDKIISQLGIVKFD